MPRTRLATATSCSPAAGTSTATTVAPSRARVSAIEAPMPRAAPVTTATRPASGVSQSSGSAPAAESTASSWPSTNADRVDRKNRRAPTHRGRRDGHVVGEHDAVAGRPAAQLLGERPQQPVDALPGGGDRRGVVGPRGARDGDHAGAAGSDLSTARGGQHRLRQLVGVRRARSARGRPRRTGCRAWRAGARRGPSRSSRTPRQRRVGLGAAARAPARRPASSGWPGLVAAQRRGLREPELLRELLGDAAVDEVEVACRSWVRPPRGSR